MKRVKVFLLILICIFIADTAITNIPLESYIKIFYEENSKSCSENEDYSEKKDIDDNKKYFNQYFTSYIYLEKLAYFNKAYILNSFYLYNIFKPPIIYHLL